ncbi:MAG: hypothetical protein HFG82_09940 [Dorea sp.]|nr:hypothetical protein [Dorea sp.]
MNEKTKLLELLKKAADAADMFKDDKREIMKSDRLSEKGKTQEIAENFRQFTEAMEGYREQMLDIVNEREKGYTSYYVSVAQTRFSTNGYQSALTANLDMIKQGYAGKIEIMAILKLYKDDDLAYSRVEDVMRQVKSPYCNLLEDRLTVKKQLNAFESIRHLIKAKVTSYLAEQQVYRPSAESKAGLKKDKFSREACYFGSGYVAIVEELNDDLTINSPKATLALKHNSDPNTTYHHGTNIDVMKAEHNAKSKRGTDSKK